MEWIFQPNPDLMRGCRVLGKGYLPSGILLTKKTFVEKTAGENTAVRGNGHFESIRHKRCAFFGRQKGRTSSRFFLKTPHTVWSSPNKGPNYADFMLLLPSLFFLQVSNR